MFINPLYSKTYQPSSRDQTFIESKEHFLSKNSHVNNAFLRWFLTPQKPGLNSHENELAEGYQINARLLDQVPEGLFTTRRGHYQHLNF